MNFLTKNKAAIVAFAGAIGVFLDAIGVHPEGADVILGQISASASVLVLAANAFLANEK